MSDGLELVESAEAVTEYFMVKLLNIVLYFVVIEAQSLVVGKGLTTVKNSY